MSQDWMLIDGTESLKEACADIAQSPIIGIDTEYDSFRYFREKLCLIQIRAGSFTYLFDPLDTYDLSLLHPLFLNPAIIKVLHAGENDIRLLNRDYGFLFTSVFDTHRAASLMGCTHLALAVLVDTYLGTALNKSKSIQRSRWDIRPLAEEQIEYAVQDTRYLIELYRVMGEKLQREGLMERAEEAFAKVTAVRWSEKKLDRGGYLKVKGAGELDPQQQERLRALYCWRFRKAERTNRARFLILSDQNLIDLARNQVDSLEALNRSGIVSSAKVESYGQELLDLLGTIPSTC